VRAIEPERFEALVRDAIDSLPEPFASHLSNVGVVVEDEPTPEQLASLGPGMTLFGLYEGVAQPSRLGNYQWVMPDKITIFRGPITRASRGDAAEIAHQVQVTVIHEIAHHFGISDERLDELGW
jgi:predicted Zn-dependent protease with MMP-like domain